MPFLTLLLLLCTDFLAFARNLSENIMMEEGKRWTPSDVAQVPLESDELALEYLCRHNYDVPLAKFKLMCQLANGKGVFLRRYQLVGCAKVVISCAFHD